MNFLKKYAFVGWLSARSNFAYFGEVLSRVVFLGVILYIFSRLWQTTYHQLDTSQLGGLTLSQMLWYLVVTEAITLSGPRVASTVDSDVRNGTLVNYLQRPISYPLYMLASNLGERLVRFLVNLLVGSAIVFVLIGAPNLSPESVLASCLVIPLAFALDFLGSFLIGLGAFWLEDTSGIYLIYSRITMILGGMLVPLSLFPQSVQSILSWLPFASIVYGPAKLFVAFSSEDFILVLARQIVGLICFSLLVQFVYSFAQKRVFVNGG